MGIKSGPAGRKHDDRVKWLFEHCELSEEFGYLLNILSNESNTLSLSELEEMYFCDLEEYNIMLDILARGKLASHIDNMPKEK